MIISEYLFFCPVYSQLAVLYSKKFGVSTKKALETIYNSNTYRQLENESTKLWHLGPVALLEHISENH